MMPNFALGQLALAISALLLWPSVTPILSTCDLVSTRDRFDGRMVRVRGVVEVSDDDEPLLGRLIPNGCESAEGKAPLTIRLGAPDAHFMKNPPAGFRQDVVSLRRASNRILTLRKEGKDVRLIIATIEGVFIKGSSDKEVQAGPRALPHGMNAGYIVVQSVRDIELPKK